MLKQIEDFTNRQELYETELDKKAYDIYEEWIDIQRYRIQYSLDIFVSQKKLNNISYFYKIALKQLRIEKLNKICTTN